MSKIGVIRRDGPAPLVMPSSDGFDGQSSVMSDTEIPDAATVLSAPRRFVSGGESPHGFVSLACTSSRADEREA